MTARTLSDRLWVIWATGGARGGSSQTHAQARGHDGLPRGTPQAGSRCSRQAPRRLLRSCRALAHGSPSYARGLG